MRALVVEATPLPGNRSAGSAMMNNPRAPSFVRRSQPLRSLGQSACEVAMTAKKQGKEEIIHEDLT